MSKTNLLKKASVNFLISGVIVLFLSGIVLYFYTQRLLRNEIEEELYSDKARVEQLLKGRPQFKGVPPLIVVEPANERRPDRLLDTMIFDPSQNEDEEFRQLSGTRLVNGRFYKITIRAMVIESEGILLAIVFTFLLIILLAFISIFFINRSQNRKLWRPFFINLGRIKDFSLESTASLKLEESTIIEFDELNREMLSLTEKVRADYGNLKQFTEDVAHEMQTPLAVMQAKIENIINEPGISEAQYGQLTSLQQDIYRLKQLNKHLNLLAKIDNRQFVKLEHVSITERVRLSMENFKELFHVEFEVDITGPLQVHIDPYLADVLCNNLLSNAVKHQATSLPIEVGCGLGKLRIGNAGIAPIADPSRLFERFYKESKHANSTGLGLAIIKKICDRYGFNINYSFVNKRHVFEIDFKSMVKNGL